MTSNKEEILKSITSYTGAENELAIKEAQHQIVIFKALFDKELKEFDSLEEKEDKSNPRELKENIAILQAIENFDKEVKQKKEKKEKEEQKNLKNKQKLLKEFEDLINNKEKLAELAKGIKEIRDQWNDIGPSPSSFQQKIQKQYSKLNELFNYNFNIYKELKENDLKRNFSLKNQIIHQLKALEEIKDISKVNIELKRLQNKWEEIGPTFKEHWEELKKNYWNEVHTIQKRINEHYSNLKTSLKENLEEKKKLIQKAKEFTSSIPNDLKQWDQSTKDIKSLQAEWKKIGPVTKKISAEVWEEFRSELNDFFAKRDLFFNNQKKIWKKRADQKQLLIDNAKVYVDNILQDSNPQLIKKLQEDWKKIGHSGKYAEQKLWRKFREQCDTFFDQKNEHRNAAIKEEKNNLSNKKELLKSFYSNKSSSYDEIKKFINEFQSIGQVPRKSEIEIMKSFESIVYKSIEGGSFSSEQQHQLKRAIKSSLLSNSADPDQVFINEKSRINKLINAALKETAQLENNLGFFANSKGSKMLDDFKSKIENQKKQIDDWREELKKLRDAYRQK